MLTSNLSLSCLLNYSGVEEKGRVGIWWEQQPGAAETRIVDVSAPIDENRKSHFKTVSFSPDAIRVDAGVVFTGRVREASDVPFAFGQAPSPCQVRFIVIKTPTATSQALATSNAPTFAAEQSTEAESLGTTSTDSAQQTEEVEQTDSSNQTDVPFATTSAETYTYRN